MAGLIDIIKIYKVTYSEDSVSRYGDPARTEDHGTIVSAAVRPQGKGIEKEALAGEDVRTSLYHVIVPPDAVLDGLSRIEWQGRSFEVHGEIQPYMYRNGLHHYEFTMRGVEGI